MKHRLLGALALSIGLAVTPAKAATEILNASYDIARELFAAIKRHPRVELTEEADHRHALAPLSQAPPEVGINARAREPLAALAAFLDGHAATRVLLVA